MITVAHLITGLSVGGTERILLQLLSKMDRRRFDNVVISMTKGGALEPEFHDLGIPVSSLGMRRGLPNPAALITLRRLLRTYRPSVLQTWLYHADLLGLLGSRIARVPSLAWNIRCSEMEEKYTSGMGGLVVRTLARLSRTPDAVVVNSEAGIRTHEGFGYRPKRWELIANGVDTEVFHPDPDARASVRESLGLRPEATLIGLVARFDPIKGHHDLLKAASRIGGGDSVHFLLVGTRISPDNAELSRMIRENALGGRISLLGERDDIPRIDAALDIAVCASLGEGFPNTIAEAMACAVPVIATRVGDAPQLIGESGLLVLPADPQALARAMTELIEKGSERRSALGRSARKRIESRYGIDAMVERYESLYASLAAIAEKQIAASA